MTFFRVVLLLPLKVNIVLSPTKWYITQVISYFELEVKQLKCHVSQSFSNFVHIMWNVNVLSSFQSARGFESHFLCLNN